MEYIKTKSASKKIIPRGSELEQKVLTTMATISKIVGGTLGPGGHPVLIERPEYNLPPIITKDGVTVFRSLGFDDPTMHCIMEAGRDASVRTANEAGDGTTCCTVLAEAFVSNTYSYCKANPNISPQNIVREIQATFDNYFLNEISKLTVPVSLDFDSKGRKLLHAVAKTSANGDSELADAVMRCYDICGDDGNVTITETSGPWGYQVEKVEGYPIAMGYEDSCQRYYPTFINRSDIQQVHVEKPVFLLYFGRVNEIQTVLSILERIQQSWRQEELSTPNVVLVATGFSESVLGSLMVSWAAPGSLNICPLVVPPGPQTNAAKDFLDDLAAVTGATVFDPVTKPLDEATFEDLGNIAQDTEDGKWKTLGVKVFEMGRYRSTVVGFCQEEFLLERVEMVKAQSEQGESELDRILTRERLAKLTGGIAKLKVIGSSNGEMKERRDRAEDAICAVRGALKHGCLVGGGMTLMRLAEICPDTPVSNAIIVPALTAPVKLLIQNAGVIPGDERFDKISKTLEESALEPPEKMIIWDAREDIFRLGIESGVIDSVPAVRDALKNAISIATLLGTLGGTVVQSRDSVVERQEARDANEYTRHIETVENRT